MLKKITETLVGLFMLLGIVALVFLALKVSGLTTYSRGDYYRITADFDNVGGLRVRAPVMVAGVSIGEVTSITLNKTDYRAHVTLRIKKDQAPLPTDTSASIYTQGILGSNYVNLSPGYTDSYLQDGGEIETTNSAVILEKLIGQFLYSFQNKKPADAEPAAHDVIAAPEQIQTEQHLSQPSTSQESSHAISH